MSNNSTQINPLANAAQTELNSALGNATVINPTVATPNATSLIGAFLADKYEVVRRLEVSTGEADIYICKHQDKEYVGKVYRRPKAVKPSILEALKAIRSPFIARARLPASGSLGFQVGALSDSFRSWLRGCLP